MIDEGDHVELVSTTDEYTDLEPGDRGIVTDIRTMSMWDNQREIQKIWVDWDDGGLLAMIEDEDQIKEVSD